MSTIQLQSIGHVPAIAASEVREGDVRLYNFGHTSLVVKVIEKTAKTLTIITCDQNGKYYMSDIRKTSLIAIYKRDQDVSMHQPKEAYNVSGKNKGLVDVSEYFQTEEVVIVEETKEDNLTIEQQKQSSEITYKLNDEKQGIEIHFDSKPSEEVREQLKINGYRWSKRGFWYAKQSQETLSLAESLAGGNVQETIIEPVSYPAIEIDDNENYTIDQRIQDAEHDASWIFRSSKTDHNKQLLELFTTYTDKVKHLLQSTDNEYIIYKLKSGLQRFKKKYHETYTKYLSHRGNNPSWAVTGRGNLNVSRYDKARDRENNLINELVNIPKDFDKYINKYRNKIKQEQKAS
jgi:hypothetical protein